MKWANKKCKNFNIYKVAFSKNILKRPGDIIILHLCSKNLDMIYSSWDILCDRLKLVVMGHFLLFYLTSNPENQNFEKIKKTSGDVIILHMCTKNYVHMMYASWDIECNRQNFLSFWAIFCPFTTLLTPKIEIWKKK